MLAAPPAQGIQTGGELLRPGPLTFPTTMANISALDISKPDGAMAKRELEEVPDPRSLLPLTPAVFHIMLALAERECHGYGIMLEVERFTQGQLRLGPGTLYRSIQRMVVDGLIEERKDALGPEDDDERRRYYRLTKFGLEVARAEAERLATLVKAARQRDLLS
jgi:DNA-binding PadR family transcriptional regulator